MIDKSDIQKLQDQLDEQQAINDDYHREIENLKGLIASHAHSGNDSSKVLDTDLTLPGNRKIVLGNTVSISAGETPAGVKTNKGPTPAYFNIGGGFPVSGLAGYYYAAMNIADQQNIQTAKRWAGTSFVSFFKDTPFEQRELSFGIDKFDPYKGEIKSAQNKEAIELNLFQQSLLAGSYVYAIQGPYDLGNSTISAGGNKLIDSSKIWVPNQFINGAGNAFIAAINPTTGAYEIHQVESNDINSLTIKDVWRNNWNVGYVVYFPVLLGSSQFPWKHIRVGFDAQIKGVGKQADGFVLYNPKNSGNTILSGDPRTIEILLDLPNGTTAPYYFNVYPTKVVVPGWALTNTAGRFTTLPF